MHQVTQIASLVEGVHVGVTLIPQNFALPDLILELGGHDAKVRDRTNTSDYKKDSMVKKFCMLKAKDLNERQIRTICWIYAADVRMFSLINSEVPLCPSVDEGRRPFVPKTKPVKPKHMTKARAKATPMRVQREQKPVRIKDKLRMREQGEQKSVLIHA